MSLAALAAAAGVSVAELARRAGLSPELLARVDAGVQGLPSDAISLLASAAGVSLGEAEAAAGVVTAAGVDRQIRRARVPAIVGGVAPLRLSPTRHVEGRVVTALPALDVLYLPANATTVWTDLARTTKPAEGDPLRVVDDFSPFPTTNSLVAADDLVEYAYYSRGRAHFSPAFFPAVTTLMRSAAALPFGLGWTVSFVLRAPAAQQLNSKVWVSASTRLELNNDGAGRLESRIEGALGGLSLKQFSAAGAFDNQRRVLTQRYGGTHASNSLRVDGIEQAPIAEPSTQNPGVTSDEVVLVGATGGILDGYLYAFAKAPGFLTDDQCQVLEAYLLAHSVSV